jgi:nitrate/nitrite transporter NarK
MKVQKPKQKRKDVPFLRIALCVGVLFLIPLIGNYTIAGWHWSLFDFIFIGILLCSLGSTYALGIQKTNSLYYKTAIGIALVAVLLLIWINGAVGIIGDGDVDTPPTLFYIGVLSIFLIGSIISGLKPSGMAKVLFITATAQALVPLLISLFWKPLLLQPPGIKML